MSYRKDTNRLQNMIYLVFVFFTMSADANCPGGLPADLQNSMWIDGSNTLTFGTTTFSGFIFTDMGTIFDAFTCISNTDNVYVFGSDNSVSTPFSDPHYYYLCMRITKVTDNSYYYYLLGEESTGTTPVVRATKSSVTHSESRLLPTCDICSDNNDGNTEAFFLRRSTVPSVPSVTADPICLPCNTTQAECDLRAEATTPAEITTPAPKTTTRGHHGHCRKRHHGHP
ncbi:Hypothetical predicted protein [Mytilus galloprovincialis]|uniref:Uncharacterized protein n=2 Tax=Mytilus galloprovincialis TaxID=29158 RepID=A0A8B6CFN8_MYTGA|nr:Hypothetical predicted protein [Mytilus galloprovincialis]